MAYLFKVKSSKPIFSNININRMGRSLGTGPVIDLAHKLYHHHESTSTSMIQNLRKMGKTLAGSAE